MKLLALTGPLLALAPLSLAAPAALLLTIQTSDGGSGSSPASPLLGALQGGCLQCNPTPPPQTDQGRCNAETTSCVRLARSGKTYCACRAGYRGNTAAPPGDTSVQFRLDGIGQDGRVFVSPGLRCDTLCDQWYLGKDGCKEVGVRAQCA